MPIEKDRIAAQTANQMKARPNTYFQPPSSGVKNAVQVATAVIVSEPPSHTGFESQ